LTDFLSQVAAARHQDEILSEQAYTAIRMMVASEIVGLSLSVAIFAIIIASAGPLNN